jgi:signal transduction histidine kinase
MSMLRDIPGETFRARAVTAYRESLGRELDPELGRLVVAATRVLLATMGLSTVFRLIPETTPVTAWQQILLLAYLSFAVGVVIAHMTSWEAAVRLRRFAPSLDRIVCVLIVVVNPDKTLLYIPFLLFLFLAPAGRINRLWLVLECLALSLAILFHNRIAGWWPGLHRVDPQLLVLQFSLMIFTAVTVLGFRLGRTSQHRVDEWNRELLDVSVNARQLPIDGIAEKLAARFGVTDLVLCWKGEEDDRPHCVGARHGDLQSVDLSVEVIDAMLAPQAAGRSFLWDSSSGNALVEGGNRGAPIFRRLFQPTVPDILISNAGRICGMPIRSGTIVGYIYLLSLPRISETVLARAVRACEAVNATLDRYQLFEAWRARAFANARLALSRDMHDSVLQTLAGLRMQVAALIKQGESVSIEERNERLEKLQSIIAAEQACLRDLLVDGDEQNCKIDLAGYLAQRIELLSRQWAIPCNLDVGDEPIWVASDVAIEVEFLVREAVSNAVQHAMATNISVIVALRDNSLFITLRSSGDAADSSKVGIAGPLETIASRSLSRRLETLGGRAYADPIESGALLSMRIPVERGTDG